MRTAGSPAWIWRRVVRELLEQLVAEMVDKGIRYKIQDLKIRGFRR